MGGTLNHQQRNINSSNQSKQENNSSLDLKKYTFMRGNSMKPIKILKAFKKQQQIDRKMFKVNPNTYKSQQGYFQKPFQYPDKRKQVDNTKFPYSAIGYLYVCFSHQGSDVPCFGTAFLIWHNVAITAAHNIYNRDRKMFISSCSFILKDKNCIKQEYEAAYVYVPEQYVRQNDYTKGKQQDYAVIILKKTQKLGQIYGYLPIVPLKIQEKNKKDFYINVSGYPKDKNYQKNVLNKKIDTMFGCFGIVKHFKNNMAYYTDVHTNPGQSGSPILIQRVNKLDVIGIHTGGDNFQNHGVILNQQILQKMKIWIIDFERSNKQCHQMKNSCEQSDKMQIKKFILKEGQIRLHKKSFQQQELKEIQFDSQTKTYADKTLKYVNNSQKYINLEQSQINQLHLIYLIRQKIFIEKIQTLKLCGNKIGDEGVKQLSHQQWNSLQVLNFTENNISIKGLIYLSRAAENQTFPQLKQLSLQKNNIGNENQKYDINNEQSQEQEGLILKFANNNTKLSKLSLSQNNINDIDMIKLFQISKKSSSHENNLINSFNSKKIFHYLKQIYLHDNFIQNEGIKAFTGQLIQFPVLQSLQMHQNKINANGVKFLLSSAKEKSNTLKNIKFLQLSNNIYIGDNGIHEFIKGCHQGAFPLLQVLSIKNINITDAGVDYLVKTEYEQCLKAIEWIKCYNNNLIKYKGQAKKKLQKRFNKSNIDV